MLQKLLIPTAASCAIISGAFAQSAQPQIETAPGEKVQTVPEAKQSFGSVSTDKFIKEQSADQWVFTKFKGTGVLGPDNARVGSVDDLLFGKNGKIVGIVVGVGGFLGLGAKNVAIGMDAFDVIPADIGSDRSNAQANDPTIVKLKVSWTKDQLMEAPDFQYFKPATRSATIPPPTTTGAAPRPMAPAAPR
jgi:hypothetical protein